MEEIYGVFGERFFRMSENSAGLNSVTLLKTVFFILSAAKTAIHILAHALPSI
jgi:hypothetical protein